MMRWLSAVALIVYLNLLITPQIASAHAPHAAPLADGQFQAISPLTGQTSLASEQDSGDDNDNSLISFQNPTARYHSAVVVSLPSAIALAQPKAAHPVRAPPVYS
ncbi:hypothetical protein [Arsukibacterium sp. UBA3155]|uniref:hypothetical protein n=1 Tax=Arsukibacterium sp. UBA3155 TaxID=1946058 RepID=UPI0025BEEE2D|nr:hypothetical protein [Arsukibacterium sp. UBA3155]|tara:strand:- start:196722 stop:197036 length:315 start_codon:yes stop_codon:yes gene_type:complete